MEWVIRMLFILFIILLIFGNYLISSGTLINRQILGRILIAMGMVYGYMALRFAVMRI